MATKAGTRSRIVSAAWKLFYEQGYEHTTVDEIIAASRPPRVLFTTISREGCAFGLAFDAF